MNDIAAGRCLCGQVRFRVSGAPLRVAHCHCQSCRRQTGAPLATFVGYERGQFQLEAGEPARYTSSPGVRRWFCGSCGSALAYEADKYPDEIHLYLSAMDEPGRFPASLHVHYAERVPWFEVHDALPRYATTGRGHQPVALGPAA
jgi:hypothetical protein